MVHQQAEILKSAIDQIEWVDMPAPPAGAAILRPGLAAMTSNNVSYAQTGDKLGYWRFFPASRDGWGIVPVWGFATVIDPGASDLERGERVYGYYPMAEQIHLQPTQISRGRFVDGAAHRTQLPAVYNDYARVKADPTYAVEKEPWRALFVPLAATAYGLADWQKTTHPEAARIIMLSASSKTAIAAAMLVGEHENRPQLIGMTAEANVAKLRASGLYDEVIAYPDADKISANLSTVVMDFAGNAGVSATIHARLGDSLLHHATVGASHVTAPRRDAGMNTARTAFFFMPSYAASRLAATGGQFIADMLAAANRVADRAPDLMTLRRAQGRAGMAALYGDVYANRLPPDEGGILDFDDGRI